MKIKLTYKKFPFYFWIPISLIGKSYIQKWLHLDEYGDFIKTLLPEIKRYTKANGHFVLIDIITEENVTIIIKV